MRAEFEEFLGTPRRIFHSRKDQILLQLELTDTKQRRHHLFFMDTGNSRCIVKSGGSYFAVARSANEIRDFIRRRWLKP